MVEASSDLLIRTARALRRSTARCSIGPPVVHVYRPLDYAWAGHDAYLRRYGAAPKRVVFLGMNPGPFGMAQTGVPFGEIAAVRDWMGIRAPIRKPAREHPLRPIEGFACPRSEVSGRRLWGLFARRFPRATDFFTTHLVLNYCPLVFMEKSGRNRTPDKLPVGEREELFAACDRHLREVVRVLRPAWVMGIGGFAGRKAREALHGLDVTVGRILHPSPASPAANRDWDGAVTRALEHAGIW